MRLETLDTPTLEEFLKVSPPVSQNPTFNLRFEHTMQRTRGVLADRAHATMMRWMKIGIAVAAIAGLLALLPSGVWGRAAEERWLAYDRQVTLEGTLLKQYHTKWIALQGDTPQARELAKTPAHMLRLNSPVSVRASKGREEERDVREIFAVLPSDVSDKEISPFVGKAVTFTGELDHASTVHHPRPILIEVNAVR